MLIGTSVPSMDIGPTVATLAPQMIRVYDDVYKARRATAAGVRVAMSFKSLANEGEVVELIKLLLPGSTVTFFHEPDDNIFVAKTLNPERWKAGTIRLCQLVAQAKRVGQVYPATIFISWNVGPTSPHAWRPLFSPDVVDALKTAQGIFGIDVYTGEAEQPRDPELIYRPGLEVAREVGLTWGCSETGVRMVDGIDTEALAGWWARAFAFASANDAYCFLLWNSGGPDVTYNIDASPVLVALWKAAAMGTYSQAQLNAAVQAATEAQRNKDAEVLEGFKRAAAKDLETCQKRAAAHLLNLQANVETRCRQIVSLIA